MIKKESIIEQLKKALHIRSEDRRPCIIKLEEVCLFFKDILQASVHKDAAMTFYVYPLEDSRRRRTFETLAIMTQTEPTYYPAGVVFSADFVITCPKFISDCSIHTVSDISLIKDETTKDGLIQVLAKELAVNKVLHDTLVYLRSDGFNHMWKDPLSEAQKEIIRENKREIDERKNGDSWKEGMGGM